MASLVPKKARIDREQSDVIATVQLSLPIEAAGDPGRRYLTPADVSALCKSAEKRGRYGRRDALMIYMAARHGLRRTELVNLRWHQIDIKGATLQVERLKRGSPAVHPLDTHELRQLGKIRKEQGAGWEFVFISERGAPMTGDGFDKMLRRAAAAIGMDGVHAHLLRHAAGYRLVNEGRDTRSIQGYLGHRAIRHTVAYTELDKNRFRGW